MPSMRNPWMAGFIVGVTAVLATAGCYNTPVDTSEFAQGPAPQRIPSPGTEKACGSYEDSLTGGQVFTMYCSYCHNAPSLAERPFANFQNVAAHMRVRANLTGKEYAKLIEFLRRWHDVPPPGGAVEPSPKRLIFAQPVTELRKESAGSPDAAPGPQPGAPPTSDLGQPRPVAVPPP